VITRARPRLPPRSPNSTLEASDYLYARQRELGPRSDGLGVWAAALASQHVSSLLATWAVSATAWMWTLIIFRWP
jgi:hypothetical protein